MTWASVRPSVRRPSVDIFSETVKWIDAKFWRQVPIHHISRSCFVCLFSKFYIFYFYLFFFIFVNILFHRTKKSCIPLGRVSTKVVQRNVNFKFWIFAIFFSFSLTWDHMGVKVSNDISSERTHQICSLKIMDTPGEGLYQNSSKNREIWNFEFLAFFFLFFFFGSFFFFLAI